MHKKFRIEYSTALNISIEYSTALNISIEYSTNNLCLYGSCCFECIELYCKIIDHKYKHNYGLSKTYTHNLLLFNPISHTYSYILYPILSSIYPGCSAIHLFTFSRENELRFPTSLVP